MLCWTSSAHAAERASVARSVHAAVAAAAARRSGAFPPQRQRLYSSKQSQALGLPVETSSACSAFGAHFAVWVAESSKCSGMPVECDETSLHANAHQQSYVQHPLPKYACHSSIAYAQGAERVVGSAFMLSRFALQSALVLILLGELTSPLQNLWYFARYLKDRSKVWP